MISKTEGKSLNEQYSLYLYNIEETGISVSATDLKNDNIPDE